MKLIDENKFVILMDSFEIGLFCIKNAKIEYLTKIKLDNTEDQTSNFVFLRDPTVEIFEFFDLINLKKYEIKLNSESLTKIDINIKKISDIKVSDNFIYYFQYLDTLLIIDKFIKFFIHDQNKIKIRFCNVKCEKLAKKFYNLYGKAEIFKYKILFETSSNLIVSVSVFNEKIILCSMIVYFKIISLSNRCGKNIELEVLNVFLGQNYKLIVDQSLYLCIYTRYEIEKDFLVDKNQFELENKIHPANIIIYHLNNDKVLTNLNISDNLNNFCLDKNLTYLVFSDKKKKLSLIRLKDCKLIGSIKLNGEDNSIKFNKNNHFICLSMYDRRLISLLIVDHDVQSQVDELISIRKSLKESNSKKDLIGNSTEIVENSVDSSGSDNDMDSTSDETSTDDEVDSVEVKINNRKKSISKINEVKIDDPSKFFNAESIFFAMVILGTYEQKIKNFKFFSLKN